MAAGFAITDVVVAAATAIAYYSQMFKFILTFASKFYQKPKIVFGTLTHKPLFHVRMQAHCTRTRLEIVNMSALSINFQLL